MIFHRTLNGNTITHAKAHMTLVTISDAVIGSAIHRRIVIEFFHWIALDPDPTD